MSAPAPEKFAFDQGLIVLKAFADLGFEIEGGDIGALLSRDDLELVLRGTCYYTRSQRRREGPTYDTIERAKNEAL